ncbi:hypothetical protein [uncultured Salinicola sp.]|uniref:hypothetical protein n=1 Tax=uncultured Salinicola sp. TaxID=1193542 RepID=UPI002638F5DE|nr:hypothetical protein [uncultured Salinicola sp.]|tara:strand:+ start:1559 stop:1732 length:174 start_codon:yes stop_codon:yes gene_type:complete
MEDRIHAAGNGEAMTAAIQTFEAGKRGREDQHVLYDELVRLGAEPEEADEYVDLMMQ